MDLWAWDSGPGGEKEPGGERATRIEYWISRGEEGDSALHIRERGGAEEKPDPPVRIVAKRGCISDAAASSLERLTRVCEPQLFMRGECSRGPRVSGSDEYAYLNSRG